MSEEQLQKLLNDFDNKVYGNSEYLKAKAEYKISKDSCIFETRNILLQIQEESAKESVLQQKRFIIQTILSVAALIAAVVAAVAIFYTSPPYPAFSSRKYSMLTPK